MSERETRLQALADKAVERGEELSSCRQEAARAWLVVDRLEALLDAERDRVRVLAAAVVRTPT